MFYERSGYDLCSIPNRKSMRCAGDASFGENGAADKVFKSTVSHQRIFQNRRLSCLQIRYK